jgi:hypothetical protein
LPSQRLPLNRQTARTVEPRGTFLSVSLVSTVWSLNARYA